MPQVILDKVSKSFAGVPVLRDVSVHIAEGEFCVLVGPSGSGKSTLLRVIAGLEPPTAGRVHIGPRDVTDLPPKARDVAMVFQSYALYPQLSVRDNMGFGLRLAGQPKATISAKVDAAAQSLGLTDLLDRFPRQLSGGQRQRVAMGRAMVRAPAVFLFDEPLSNLDASLRSSVRAEIRAMHARSKTTSVYVTHDQTEAMTLGDRIVVLRNGAVEQSGTPQALYQAPVNRFVASFIGTPAMNFLQGRLAPDAQGQLTFTNTSGQVQLPVPGHSVQTGSCTLGLRPEHGTLVAAGTVAPAAAFALSCQVQSLEFTGADTFVTVHTPVGSVLVKCDDRAAWRAGDAATLLCSMDRLHVFDAAEQRLALTGWGA